MFIFTYRNIYITYNIYCYLYKYYLCSSKCSFIKLERKVLGTFKTTSILSKTVALEVQI